MLSHKPFSLNDDASINTHPSYIFSLFVVFFESRGVTFVVKLLLQLVFFHAVSMLLVSKKSAPSVPSLLNKYSSAPSSQAIFG